MKKFPLKISRAFFSSLLIFGSSACSCAGESYPDFLQDAVHREDFRSVYSEIGDRVTRDSVREDAYGKAYATVDGVEYELGMDFLSMAMV